MFFFFKILSVNVGLDESANAILIEPIKIRHNDITEKRRKFPIPGTNLTVGSVHAGIFVVMCLCVLRGVFALIVKNPCLHFVGFISFSTLR